MIKRLNWLYSQLLLGGVLLCASSIHAQQTHLLVDPAGAGGFELGTTFESNGWTVINEAQTNKWVLGAVPDWFAGNRGAYVSNDEGVSYAYSNTVSRVHFYRDIAFPVGSESVSINLDVFQAGESSYDNVMVYITDTSITPSSLGPTGVNTTTTAWANYEDGVTGYYLDRKVGASTATLTNMNIVLNADQINYVAGTTKRLIITWKNDGSGGAQPSGSVDNIEVEAYVPVCFMVNDLSTSNVTSSSFTASWTAEANVSGYTYEVRTSGLPGSGEQGLISTGNLPANTSTFNTTGLFANATYNIFVKKDCSTELGESSWNEINVTTLCGISTFFTENFDTTDTGSSTNPTVPNCWFFIDGGSGSGYVSTTADFSLPNGFYLSNSTDTTNDYILVSPQTENLGNGAGRIRFKAKTTSTSQDPSTTLNIVTLQNQESIGGMVDVDTKVLTTDFQEFIVNLPAGTNDYFGFRHGLNANSRLIYIDDVVFEEMPACSSPVELMVDDVSANSITLAFSLPVGLPANAQFEYEVRTSGLPGSGEEGLFSTGFVAATQNTVTINDLDHSTVYMIYLRANCGSESIDSWREVEASTSCGVYTTISESFDDTATGTSTNPTIPLCWSFIDEGTGSGYVSASADFSLPNGFYLTNSSDLTGNYVLVSPETNNLGNGNYRLRFKAKTTSSSGEELEILTLPGSGSTDSSVLIETVSLTSTFNEFIVYFPVGNHDFFGLKHGQTGTSRVIYIDDVVLEQIPTCVEVQNFAATMNYQESSILLTWENPNLVNLANDFEVEYGLPGFELGTGTTQLVTGLNTTITGLTIGTTYQFYVRRICTETDKSAWSVPVSVLLDYCTSVPTSIDYLGITSFNLGAYSHTISPDFYEEDENYLNLLSTIVDIDSQAITPSSILFNTKQYDQGTHIWIDFNKDGTFDNETEKVFSGTSEPGEGTAENLELYATTLDSSFEITDIYSTGNYRMRIAAADSGQNTPNPCYSGGFGVTIDITVNISFPCLDPVDLVVSDITTSSATLNWNAAGTSFDIEYGPQGFQQGTGTIISNVNSPYELINLTQATDYSFYVKQICVDGQSGWSTIADFRTLCATASPTGASFQTLVEDDFVSNIIVEGESLKYYTDVDMTQEVLSTSVLVEGYYYITQTIDCESDLPLEVYVTLIERIDEPVVSTTQEFCESGTLADLEVQGLPGATVNWYADATSSQVLTTNTVLITGTYYVNQTDGETTSHRIAVNVIINEIPVDLVSTQVLVCGYANYGSLQVGQLDGVTMKWYASLTATTPISNTQQVVTGTYYVTQSFGICESNKVEMIVSAFDELPSPIAATQTFCGSGLVSQLVAEGVDGAQLKWFGTATSTTELSPNAQLVSGTYYVDQHKNGCVSQRKAVAIRVVSMSAPEVDSFTFCGSADVSDLIIPSQSGVTHKWYNSPSNPSELSQNTPLLSGTYFVSRVQNGCESQRSAVQVNIEVLPTAPSGAAVQTFIEGSVITDLILNQSNIIWYASYEDSQNGVNPLVADMPLVNGQTYYAVIIGFNGCPSLPFAVTVDVYLSNDQFDKDELKYFPNPVDDVLTISYSEIITQIEVFDLLGKRVKTILTNENEVKVDFTNLPSGTYLVQLKTDTKQQFVKIIKR